MESGDYKHATRMKRLRGMPREKWCAFRVSFAFEDSQIIVHRASLLVSVIFEGSFVRPVYPASNGPPLQFVMNFMWEMILADCRSRHGHLDAHSPSPFSYPDGNKQTLRSGPSLSLPTHDPQVRFEFTLSGDPGVKSFRVMVSNG